MQSRSGTLKRKRLASNHCSDIENEPLQEEKRLKKEHLISSEANVNHEEGVSDSELSVLRQVSVAFDSNDAREDQSTSGKLRDSVVSSPFSEEYLSLSADKLLTKDCTSGRFRDSVVSSPFSEDYLSLSTDKLLNKDCSPESLCDSIESSHYKGDVLAKEKTFSNSETSLKTDPLYLPKDCKFQLHCPKILCKFNGASATKWRNKYISFDTEIYKNRNPNLFDNHPELEPRMRALLLEWLIEVCFVHNIHRETFHLAVDIIDRYLCLNLNESRAKFQLLGISCLLIACKIEEMYPPKVAELSYITDGACCDQDILTMELDVIKALDWNFKCITSNCWLLIYLQLGYFSVRKEETLEYMYPLYPPDLYSTAAQLLDLATLDILSLRFKYSILAISALHIVCCEQFPFKVSGYQLDEIKECVQWMEAFWRAIYDKKKRENPAFELCSLLPPKRLVRNSSHLLQQHNVNLDLLESAQANVERSMNPSPSSPNILTPPSSSKKLGYTQVLPD